MKTSYRELQRPSMYREWHPPLFGCSALTQTTRPLRVMVWTDEAPEPGARVSFEVFRADGTTMESIADVTWVDPQPNDGPARFQLGLAVFAQTTPHLEELEQWLG